MSSVEEKCTLFVERTSLLNVVNHIFLPRQLPGRLDEMHLVELENYLLCRFSVFLSQQDFHDTEFERVKRLFSNWSSLQRAPTPAVWTKSVGELTTGDSFAFFVREQNSAIIITRIGKSNNESNLFCNILKILYQTARRSLQTIGGADSLPSCRHNRTRPYLRPSETWWPSFQAIALIFRTRPCS